MQIGSLGSASAAAQAASTQQQIDIAVISKAQEVAKSHGEAAISLIEGVAESTAQHQSAGGHQLDVTV